MNDLVKYNPFRVLGVYANSPKKMIMANKSRINAYLKVGKVVEFPEDFKIILEPFVRDSKLVTKAESQLALPEEALKYSLFWFVKSTPVDSVAFNHLIAGNIEQAKFIWRRQDNASSLQNLQVLSIIQEEYGEALSIAQKLYKNHSSELLKIFEIETLKYDSFSIFQLFVDSLIEEKIDLVKYIDSSLDDQYRNYVYERQVKPLISQIENAISESQSKRKKKEPKQCLEAGKKLKRIIRPLLLSLRKMTTKNDALYKILADKASQEVLQCAIDYYNNTDDILAARTGLPLMIFAKSIAMSQLVIERCEVNIKTLEKADAALPPTEVINQDGRIDSKLNEFYQKLEAYNNEAEEKKQYLKDGEVLNVTIEHPSILAMKVLKKIRADLVDIKSILGKDHPFYLNLSTNIANLILKATIVDVNSIWDESVVSRLINSNSATLSQLEIVFGNSYRDLLYVEMMDLHEEFRLGTLKKNKETLIDIIDSFHGFKEVKNPSNYYLGNSAFHGLSGVIEKYALINNLFFMTDDECFKACSTLADFTFYRDSFPNGKYIEDAEEAIEELEHKRKMQAIIDRARKQKQEEERKKKEEEEKKRKEAIAQEEKRKKHIKSLIQSATDCIELHSIRTQYGDIVYECGFEYKFYSLCLNNDNLAYYLSEFPNGNYRWTAQEYLRKKKQKVSSAGGKSVKVDDDDKTGTEILLFVFITIIVFLTVAVINANKSNHENSSSSYAYSDDNNRIEQPVSNSEPSSSNNVEQPVSKSKQETRSETGQGTSADTKALSKSQLDYEAWKDYYLPNGSEPYADWYGYNSTCDSYGCSAMVVNAPNSSDVVVIIKDSYGDVVRHAYIRRNQSYRFEFPDGVYQPFFYFGNGWNPYKEMPNGLKGGFVSDSYVSKDSPTEYSNEIMTYTLKLQKNGNFSAQHSNINEAF